MKIDRNKDGSVIIRGKNGVTAISKIISNSDNVHEERFRQWVDKCAKLINPEENSFRDTVNYYLTLCDTVPLAEDDKRLRHFKSSIIINYFKEKQQHQPTDFSFEMSDEEIEVWHIENEAMRLEELNASPEHFGLVIKGYCLPQTGYNSAIYDQSSKDWEKHNMHKSIDFEKVRHQEICFFFEETTETIKSTGGGNELLQKLILFRGIGEKDIEERNARFLGYISNLREMGKLPNF